MKYECPLCDCELEEETTARGEEEDNVLVCMNKDCPNYDKVVYDSGDISRMKDDERTEAQIEDYLLEQAREGNLE